MNRLRPQRAAGPLQTHVGELTGRQRVDLAPGHSLMDWIRLGREKGDLSGVARRKEVSLQELATHNTEADMWMAVKGKVYNMTPYLGFHPGGVDELMRAAGADGTQMFEEIHSWVNVESMLSKCLVGSLTSAGGAALGQGKKRLSLAPPEALPPPTLSRNNDTVTPTYDWYQTSSEVILVIYTKSSKVGPNRVVVDVGVNEVIVEVYVKDYTYTVHFKPAERLEETCRVTTKGNSPNTTEAFKSYLAVKEKVEVTFQKKCDGNWASLGTRLKLDQTFVKTKFAEPRFWQWQAVSNKPVTHDTRLIGLKSPPGTHMVAPIGHHFIVHHTVEGMEIARSYTVVLPSLLPVTVSGTNSGRDELTYFMIKCYKGGAVSPWITSIKPGDTVKMNRFDGSFEVSALEGISHLVMFAAGTGFTAMIRPLYYALYQRPDNGKPIQMTLLFYNKSVKDILWKDQLEELSRTRDDLTVVHCLSQDVPQGWTGLKGRVCMDHFRQFVPAPSGPSVQPLVLVCGQFAYNDAVESMAKTLGLESKHIHIFSSLT